MATPMNLRTNDNPPQIVVDKQRRVEELQQAAYTLHNLKLGFVLEPGDMYKFQNDSYVILIYEIIDSHIVYYRISKGEFHRKVSTVPEMADHLRYQGSKFLKTNMKLVDEINDTFDMIEGDNEIQYADSTAPF